MEDVARQESGEPAGTPVLGTGQQFELDLLSPAASREAGADARFARNVPALLAYDLDSNRSGNRPRPQKAQPSLIPQDAIAFDAFRLTLVQCRWHISANMAATAESREIEGLHQLRVALRRLRVALA